GSPRSATGRAADGAGPKAVPAGTPDARGCAGRLIETVPAAMDAIRQSMRRHVDADTSIPQYRCLSFVSRRPGCTIGEVAAFLGVTMPTASATVDRLVRAGALRTRADAADRRRTLLETTAAGAARLERIRRGAQDDFTRRLAVLDAVELATLDAALALLRRVARPE
ncbi:MAG: MarR family winged helix-turn-helix transcriptional regulator, partial [Burkholderiales bacterium]